MNKIDYITVSVIIPTYNYAHYITKAIESILQQDYSKSKIEIIIVDDGSTDNTKDVLESFIQNKQINYFYQVNRGKASATAEAIKKSNGKYIFNLDADDYFLPGKIKRTVDIFEKDESIVHVASPAKIFDQDKNVVTGSESLPKHILNNAIKGATLLDIFYENNIFFGSGSTYAARAAVLKKINIPDTVDMYIDEFLVLAIFPSGKSFFIEQPLSVWRMHNSNYSSKTLKQRNAKIKRRTFVKIVICSLEIPP